MIINEILTKISQPNMENNWILIPTIIMVISIFIPCIVWFVRNFLRIVLNKNISRRPSGLRKTIDRLQAFRSYG